VYVSFSRYKSEDGILVQESVKKYKSDEEATAALERLTKSASHILQQDRGKIPGDDSALDRVELSFDHVGAEIVISWRDKASVVVLRSSSRRHVED
jgi:hypothetical protein